MQVSVIIPTYNRKKDLDECLSSILLQTVRPYEVVIVDDSENNEILDVIEQRKLNFKGKIRLRYIRNKREKSNTIARNIGIANAAGDIILFLDSDVLLDKNYLLEILKVYEEKPSALGVQGLIQTSKEKKSRGYFTDVLRRIFYLRFFEEKNKARLLPSMGTSFSYIVDDVFNCEWLSGANNSYKKEILEKFQWDENLKKYSWGDDLDLSYRIFKKYPDALFMTPYAKLIHKASQEGRHPRKDVVYMEMIYCTYLFYKNIEQNKKNKLIYLWSRIGRILIEIMTLFLKPSKQKLTELRYLFLANLYCVKHIREIRAGNLDFFNNNLKE